MTGSGVGPPRDVAAGAEHRLGEGRSRAPGVAVVVFDEAGFTDVGDECCLACRVDEAVGSERMTTNNREELKAVREALRAFRARVDDDPSWRIVVRTDSMGVINWLTGRWKRKKNLDLYPDIDALLDSRVRFEYVRGHSGDPGNERVDQLAVAETQRLAGALRASEPV